MHTRHCSERAVEAEKLLPLRKNSVMLGIVLSTFNGGSLLPAHSDALDQSQSSDWLTNPRFTGLP